MPSAGVGAFMLVDSGSWAGSGPEAGLQEAVGAPLVFLGVGLPDDQIHAPNEKVTLAMLFKGAEAAAHLWQEFAALGRDGLRG